MTSRYSPAHKRMTLACLGLLASPPLLAAGIEHDFVVEPEGRLLVEAEAASIRVTGDTEGQVNIRLTRGDDSERRILRDYRVEVKKAAENTVHVEIEARRPWQGLFALTRRHLEVEARVPHGFDADVTSSGGAIDIADLGGTARARTSGGKVAIEDIEGPVSARSSGGSIQVEGAGDEVRARTSGGSIAVSGTAGAVWANTSGGSIDIEETGGPITARTSGGSIRADFSSQPPEDSTLTTSGGGVTVYLGDTLGFDLDARTSGGKVTSDFAVTTPPGETHSRGRLAGSVNGGGPGLVLRTSGGSIRVLRR